MTDPFLELVHGTAAPTANHSERRHSVRRHSVRKHSKFAASASERWFNCSGSVALSEGLPDKSSKWAEEGTRAHEVLEQLLLSRLGEANTHFQVQPPHEMRIHAQDAANFILGLYRSLPESEVMVETRIHLDFIDPEMFGTFDGAVVDFFGTLHVFDYKYGAGHPVSVKENLQMIFYAIGLAHKFHWNFKRVRMWIIQPRIKGYDGPTFWDVSTPELRAYVDDFRRARDRVREYPGTFKEGSWCHWCRAKSICPLKRKKKLEAASVFLLPVKP